MNKFISLVATLALACLSVASGAQINPNADVESQSFLQPTNAEENANLKGKQLLL